jgi:hypothetical protein
MLKPEQVPIDVVREMYRQMIMPGAEDDPRRAIAAVLNVWPGMIDGKALTDFQGVIPAIILPLTTENTND